MRLLLVRHELVEAAVRFQHVGDRDGAVGLEAVLQERDEHARRRDHGIVQRVREILLAVLSVHADAEAARLGVAERGAGADLEILLLARGPRLDVERLHLQVGEVAGAIIALGAVMGVTWRVMKKKTQKVLKIDENSKKEMEEDVQIIEDNDASYPVGWTDFLI